MSLNILFDYQIFFHQQYGGISRYIAELSRHLVDFPETASRIYAGRHHNAYLEDVPKAGVIGRRVPRSASRFTETRLLLGNAAAFFQHAMTAPATHIHLTYFYELFRPLRKATRILTVYDMTHELFAEQISGSRRVAFAKRRAVASADHVICISASTKRDLHERTGIADDKASVIHLGLSRQWFQWAADPGLLGLQQRRPYLLYVGKRGGYKNFATLARAYASSARLLRDFDIVCFGDVGFTAEEQSLFRQLGLDEASIRHITGDDRLLAAAYKGAAMMIYPSRYEGFGFPPLEAMSLGCPVGCSNSSSMPEVVDAAAVTFDPDSAEDILGCIESVVFDEQKQAHYRAAGFVRAAEFTWERCARQTRELYLRTLS